MFIGVMKKGDRVISVTSELIAVERKNGEVDIIPLTKDETGLRVDIEGIVTIECHHWVWKQCRQNKHW